MKSKNTKAPQVKSKKPLVDFTKLSTYELKQLSSVWEKEAVIFEQRLDKLMFNVGNTEDTNVKAKIERLWNAGNGLWKRLRILETYRRKEILKLI